MYRASEALKFVPNLMEYQDEAAMKRLHGEMWGEVLAWMNRKFKDVRPGDLCDRQLLSLHAAMCMEEDCKYCIDISQCPHSKAALVVCEEPERGRRAFVVRAKICDFLSQHRQEAHKRDLLAESGIPNARRENTFQAFDTLGGSQLLQATKAKAQECLDKGRGLVLGGPVGCGKTHLAIAMGLSAIERGQSARFFLLPDLLDDLRDEMFDHRDELISEVKSCGWLILDDAGTERDTNWNDERLFVLIDHRCNHNLPVVVTTNAVGEDGIRKILHGERGLRTLSRLMSMTEQAWMVGVPDYRRKGR
ncbi:MAG: ATP-binding protein [bacterium]|nr:ATP-binding protein [bacterium]